MSELASESSGTMLADVMTLPRLAASGQEGGMSELASESSGTMLADVMTLPRIAASDEEAA